MIRGPVLPMSRDALWSLVATRLDAVERGLTVVAEAFDCSGGSLGPVDALARDALGSPVLVLLATEGDALLAARAMAAADFLDRVGDALAAAVPEASFTSGSAGRVIVVAVERCAAACDALARHGIPGLQICRLEPFRIAGAERFAVRWLPTGVAARERSAAVVPAPEFAVPAHVRPLWHALLESCQRIDAAVQVTGDRFRRRVTWNGHVLAEVQVAESGLTGSLPDGASPVSLATAADVRAFTDRVLRSFAAAAGLTFSRSDARGAAGAAEDRAAAARSAAIGNAAVGRANPDSLRAVAAHARLTPEEYSALGGPTSAVGDVAEAAATADDVVRIVAAQEGSRPLPGRRD